MIRIIEADAATFRDVFPQPSHVFNTVDFAELNKHKVERVRYLLFEDTKLRAGIILGERENSLSSPFSAPYGGLISHKPLNLETLDSITDSLVSFSKDYGKDIEITLPPLIYGTDEITKTVNVLSRKARLCHIDLNYSFDLSLFSDYISILKSQNQRTLRAALRNELHFEKLDSNDEKDVRRAYNVIKANHIERGFPVRMSIEDVIETIKIIPADFFVLSHQDTDIAASQVFHTAENIVQMIYWGDIREFYKLRTMNRLSYEMFKYYYEQGLKTLDLGPSSQSGIPNYGLSNFKENIGCSISPKFSFVIEAAK